MLKSWLNILIKSQILKNDILGGKVMIQSRPTTYSLLMRDPINQKIGVITQSKYLAIGSLVHLFNKNFGIVVSQGWPDLKLADKIIQQYIHDKTDKLDFIKYLKTDKFKDYRQFGALTVDGNGYVYTGDKLKKIKGGHTEKNIAVVGNFLQSNQVIEEMVNAARDFKSTNILDALYHGIMAGLTSGGEVRGQQSASVKVWSYSDLNRLSLPDVDLRVDSSAQAIGELGELIKEYKLYFEKTQKSVPLYLVLSDFKRIVNTVNLNNPRLQITSLIDILRYENLEGRWINNTEIDYDVLNFLKQKYL